MVCLGFRVAAPQLQQPHARTYSHTCGPRVAQWCTWCFPAPCRSAKRPCTCPRPKARLNNCHGCCIPLGRRLAYAVRESAGYRWDSQVAHGLARDKCEGSTQAVTAYDLGVPRHFSARKPRACRRELKPLVVGACATLTLAARLAPMPTAIHEGTCEHPCNPCIMRAQAHAHTQLPPHALEH